MIIFADRQGVIRLWNPAAEAVFGFSADEVIGQISTLVFRNACARHWKAFHQAIEAGRTRLGRRALVTRSVHKSGARLYVDLSPHPEAYRSPLTSSSLRPNLFAAHEAERHSHPRGARYSAFGAARGRGQIRSLDRRASFRGSRLDPGAENFSDDLPGHGLQHPPSVRRKRSAAGTAPRAGQRAVRLEHGAPSPLHRRGHRPDLRRSLGPDRNTQRETADRLRDA